MSDQHPRDTTMQDETIKSSRRNRWATAADTTIPTPPQGEKLPDTDDIKIKSEQYMTTSLPTTTTTTTTTTASLNQQQQQPPSSTGLATATTATTASSTTNINISPSMMFHPTVINSYHNHNTIKHLLSLPGGQTLAQQYSQHLLPMTSDYLNSILPPNFVSISPPVGYVPPTRTESKNFIVDFSFFAKNLPKNGTFSSNMGTNDSNYDVNPSGIINGDDNDQILQHGVMLENIPDELTNTSLSRNDMFVFNDLFTGKLTDVNARRAVISIILIKNGTGRERKSTTRKILKDFGKTLKLEHYLEPLLSYLEHGIKQQDLADRERHVLFSLLSKLVPLYRSKFVPYVSRLMNITRTFLIHKDRLIQQQGGAFIQMLTRVVGIHPILKVVLSDVNSSEDSIRDVVAKSLGYVTTVVGIKQVLPFLEALLKSNTAPFYAVFTGLRTIYHIAVLSGSSLVPDMESLITLIIPTFFKNDTKLIKSALDTISKVCTACTPYISPSIDEVAKIVATLAPKCKGRVLTSLVQCVTSFLPSLPLEHGIVYWDKIQTYVTTCCQNGDSQSLIIGVTALSAAISAQTIPSQSVLDHIVPFLAHHLLDPKYCIERANVNVIKSLCLTLAARLGLEPIYDVLIPLLLHENPFLSTAVATIIASLGTKIGLQTLPDNAAQSLIDFLIKLLTTNIGFGTPSASRKDDEIELFQSQQNIPSYILNTIDKTGSWTRYPILESLSLILIALGPQRAEKYTLRILGFSKWILSHKNEIYRYHGTVIITHTISQLSTPNEENKKILRDTWSLLYENLGEEKPIVLSGILCALRATLQTMKQLNFWMIDANLLQENSYSKTMVGNSTNGVDLTPSPTDVLTKLTAMLHNRHECVMLTATRVLSLLGSCWGFITPSQEWVRIVTQFVTSMLLFGHRCIRKSVVSLISICAASVGSVDIILKLIPHLEHPSRTVRIGIMASIGAVSETCGSTMVFPLLFHHYEISDIKTCTAILKSIIVCVEQANQSDIQLFPTVLYPLLTHALTSKHSKIIRLGLHLSASILIGCMSNGYNEIGKQFSEAIGAYLAPLRAVNYNINSWWWEWRRIALAISNGLSGTLVRALYVGMFHCATRVRQNHFIWYNQLLLLKQQAMPMHYAKMTSSNKLVNNNGLDGVESHKNDQNENINDGNDDDDDDEVTLDDIASNQYYDPYMYQSLYVPF
jgi:splicing factor 3B subunit 1